MSTALFEIDEEKIELESIKNSLIEVLTDDMQQLSAASRGLIEANVSKLKKCVEVLEGQSENLAARLCRTESVVSSKDEVVANLQQECDRLHSSLAQVRMQLSNDVNTANVCIERLRTEMADNSTEVDAFIDEKIVLSERLFDIIKQHESTKKELHCCRAQLLQQQASTTAMHSTLWTEFNDMQTWLSSVKEALLADENTAPASDRKYCFSEGKLDAMKDLQELRSALMRSQEDADCYRKEYNGVLLKLVSFKKAKESAERALNRYKNISDMRRRCTMQGVKKQTGRLTEVVTQSAETQSTETQSICVVPAAVVSHPSTIDDRVLNSNTSVGHSSTKSSESGCSLLPIRHKTSNTMECCVIHESSPPCCSSLSASDGHVNITVSTAISAQPSLTTEETCLSNNSCQSDKALLPDGCSTELIGQLPKTDKGFGQGCDQDVDVTINGSHLGMMTRNRFCQTKGKLCQDALAHTTVSGQRKFTNPDGARSKNPAFKSVLGINKPTAALNSVTERRGVMKGLNQIVDPPGVYPDPVKLTGKTKSTTDWDRFCGKNCQANYNVNQCKQS